jgi:hypothetical protein
VRDRYLNTPNIGSAKVPSILYYDNDGKFCGVENGVGVQGDPQDDGDDPQDDNFLKIKWWETAVGSLRVRTADELLGGN